MTKHRLLPERTRAPRRKEIPTLIAMVGILVLSACSGATADSNPSATVQQTDCPSVRAAMGDYSVALVQLAQALEGQDPLVAVASADAMSFAAEQVLDGLPGAPDAAAQFVTASQNAATLVKQGLADEVPYADIIGQLTEAFADEAFTVGGDALERYVESVCPEGTLNP